MQTSSVPRFTGLGEYPEPVLGALTTSADPEPQDVPLAIHADPHSCLDRPVGDLAVTDLDHDRVDEDHRVDAIERAAEPIADRQEPGR